MPWGLFNNRDSGARGSCATCGRECVATVSEEDDLRAIYDIARLGGRVCGSLGGHKCALCWETEKRLEAYLLVGGAKARTFVLEVLAKTERAVDGKYPRGG